MTVLPQAAATDGPFRPPEDRAEGTGRVARLGGPGAVVLSGPPASPDPEDLDGHTRRWGPLPDQPAGEVRRLLRDSRADGRGGGGFPVARKIETALLAPGRPLLVINASESEPASAKDRTLCRHRPHLALDGAALLARALGVDEVVVHAHRGAGSPARSLATAIAHRVGAAVADPSWRLSEGPDRYVAGEASAVASFVDGGEARPSFLRRPLAVEGPSGRPTVVANVETAAQVAVAARLGAENWNGLGAPSSPGPRLVTLAGSVPEPGLVLELAGSATIGDVLTAAGCTGPPAAVLVGGFAGTWLRGDEAWQTPFTREALGCLAAAPGCGLLGVLPHEACPLHETARIVRYLAGESAGQCGACVAGLPRLADGMAALAAGHGGRRGVRRMSAVGRTVLGSGACGHPDGVVRLVRSALDVFGDDVVRHRAGGPCRGSDHPPVLPVPEPRPAPTTGGAAWA